MEKRIVFLSASDGRPVADTQIMPRKGRIPRHRHRYPRRSVGRVGEDVGVDVVECGLKDAGYQPRYGLLRSFFSERSKRKYFREKRYNAFFHICKTCRGLTN